MKLVDKLKNIFFEEVEVDEDEEELPKTYAKKVEIPKKNVEVKKEENVVRDVTMDISPVIEETKDFIEEKQEEPIIENKDFPMMFDDDDFLEDSTTDSFNVSSEPVAHHREERKLPEEKELYHGKKEMSYVESINKPNYSYTKSYYEEKETKGFKPSPIISPIYGILDKNYHKEEVVTKRETRIVSNYNKPDLDTVRNKAFGGDENEKDVKIENKRAKTFEKEDKKVYDVNSNKPQVNRVTIADADEYYNDLGLAYNVDYSDASRTNDTRSSKYSNKDKKKNNNNDNDNLFDLIDSMYNKED